MSFLSVEGGFIAVLGPRHDALYAGAVDDSEDEVAYVSEDVERNLASVVQTQGAKSLYLELNEIKPAGTNALKKNKARIMVSSLMSPKDLLYRGCIRKDLYYRIEGSCVYLPELREIKNDLKAFVTFFMGNGFKLQDGVVELLSSYEWPGNIRELKNAVEKAKCLAGKDGMIKKSHFSMNNKFDLKHERIVDPNRLYTFENQERRFIFTSLNRNKWNIVDTARDLKLCRITLMAKIKHYGLKEQH